MNKFYTLLLALVVALPLSAREFSFYQGNTKIEPNSTIYFSDMEVVTVGGGYREVTIDPKLYVSSDIMTATAKVTATCRNGVQFQMCAGGNCEFGTTITKGPITLASNQMLPLQLEYINTEVAPGEEIPTLTIDVEATDTRYTNVSTKFTIVMGPEASSLTQIEAAKNSLGYTSGAVQYSLAAPSQVTLYSITGSQVLSFRAEGNGSVNTHRLQPGVYIYSIKSAAGKQSGKIVVR